MDVARPTVGGRIAEDHQLTGEGIGIAILIQNSIMQI